MSIRFFDHLTHRRVWRADAHAGEVGSFEQISRRVLPNHANPLREFVERGQYVVRDPIEQLVQITKERRILTRQLDNLLSARHGCAPVNVGCGGCMTWTYRPRLSTQVPRRTRGS